MGYVDWSGDTVWIQQMILADSTKIERSYEMYSISKTEHFIANVWKEISKRADRNPLVVPAVSTKMNDVSKQVSK